MTTYSYEEISEYVNKCECESRFIDISILEKMIDHSNLTYSQKYEILRKTQTINRSIINVFEQENKNLSNYQSNHSIDTPTHDDIIETVIPPTSSNSNTIKKVNSKHYLKDILKFTDFSELEEYLKIYISNDDFFDSINILITDILEEIAMIKKLKNEEYITKGIVNNDFDPELEKLNNILKILYKYQYYKPNNPNSSKNIIIYLPTEYGNINIASDLKAIPIEFYDSFYSLISSIQDGTFKKFKRLSTQSDNYKTTLLQVKEGFSRVVYSQLEPNVFVILTIFVKKVRVSKDYHNNLKTVDSLLHKQLSYLTNQLKANRDEFIKLNNSITDSLFEKFLTKNEEVNINENISRKVKK